MSDTANAPLKHWIERYDRLYQNRRYAPLHDIAALSFVLGILCAMKALPVPAEIQQISRLLDWSTLLLLTLIIYQCILSVPLALAVLPLVPVLTGIVYAIDLQPINLGLVSAALIGIAFCLDLASTRNKSLSGLIEFTQLAALTPLWRVHHAVQMR
ncbi:MAG: hypothetical protein AAFO81_04105 [Pseudomonadota bacterium]